MLRTGVVNKEVTFFPNENSEFPEVVKRSKNTTLSQSTAWLNLTTLAYQAVKPKALRSK